MLKNKLYISTAIPYVNAKPHVGFALEIIQSDVIARYHRSRLKEDVFFLTGTDENSLKNVRAAKKEGIDVKELVDKNAEKFYQLKNTLNLSLNDFIRTTEERHIKGAQKLWLACKKDIYKKSYKGLYCVGCEEFYKKEKLEEGLCPEHKVRPESIEEENYFFKLSKYQDQLKDIIEKDKVRVIPETRKNEVLSFISQGLEDICISRSEERSHGWGIPVPDDSSQRIWVWYDALSNYINALGYGEDKPEFKEWWEKNDNKLHVIGKGILRFHAVYWPGILLSANVPLPNQVFVHGYLTVDGQKMSKSLGNLVDPFELVEKYGTDAVRYFLLREIPSTEDGDFTYEKFEARYNADLANGLGNLMSRIISLAGKINLKSGKIDYDQIKFRQEINNVEEKYNNSLKEFKFNEALTAIWELISFCDQYIEKDRLWEKKEGQENNIISLLYVLSNIASMLKPFLPETSKKIESQIKSGEVYKDKKWAWEFKAEGKTPPLFKRLD
ncbi:MAG: class I tRNA ligase family protein [Patescibacteria group bacterium]|nr:class I tRNA ligase family protein [Patescibacteria group bacterium]